MNLNLCFTIFASLSNGDRVLLTLFHVVQGALNPTMNISGNINDIHRNRSFSLSKLEEKSRYSSSHEFTNSLNHVLLFTIT